MEYMKKGIRINAVAPGGTSTPLVDNVRLPQGVDILRLQVGILLPVQPAEDPGAGQED